MVDERAYRVLLQDLHNEIPDADLKSLKFLSQPLVQKRVKFESITDGLALFEALENCNMLSSRNLAYLSEVLGIIDRLDLQARVDEEYVSSDAESGEDTLVCPFRKLLYNLHKELPDDDLQRLRFLYGKVPRRATVDDPLDLFTLMIRDRSLSPEDFTNLENILFEISRQDLLDKIHDFKGTFHPQDCNYHITSGQSTGPNFQQASLERTGYQSASYEETTLRQECGYPIQDSQMSGPEFQQDSLEYNSAGGNSLSNYSYRIEDRIADLKAAAPPAPMGMATAATVGDCLHDFNILHAKDEVRAPRDCYKMEADPRGCCIIIDIQAFAVSHLKYRAGSEIDRAQLEDTFHKLKFTVKEMVNRTAKEVIDGVEAISKADHSAYDCLVICILSHGGISYFYGHDGEKIYEHELFYYFSAKMCPSLADKPKLFFFSYCRGNEEQEGIETDAPVVPDYSDFLFGYATPENFVSYRHKSKGTFYIEVLTRVLKEDADRLELQHLLLRVNREVAEKHTGTSKRQIPKPEHTLKKQLYFL